VTALSHVLYFLSAIFISTNLVSFLTLTTTEGAFPQNKSSALVELVSSVTGKMNREKSTIKGIVHFEINFWYVLV